MAAIRKMTTVMVCLAFSFILSSCSNTSQPDKTAAFEHQSPQYHIGSITPEVLLKQYPRFAPQTASDGQPATDDEIAELAKQLDQRKILVLFGTWCHDSQREVPRLLSLLNKVRSQHSNIEFELSLIAAAPYAKRDLTLIKQYQLTSVPTIILFDKDHEIGRIVERTKVSMVADIINMTL